VVSLVAELLAARRMPRLPTAQSSAPGWAHSIFGRARATWRLARSMASWTTTTTEGVAC